MRHLFTSASLLLLLSTACALEPEGAIPQGTAVQEAAGGNECEYICCNPGCNLQTTQMVAYLGSMNSLMGDSLAAGSNSDALNISATGGLEQTADGRNVLRHLIGCALPEDERFRIEVHGEVRGDIVASESITIDKEAHVSGNVRAPRVIIHDGAHFSGAVEMDVDLPEGLARGLTR